MNTFRISLVAALAASLAACGGAKQDDTAPAEATTTTEAAVTTTTAANAAPAVFTQCKSCHAVEKGKNLIGPSLAGIVGTKAGDVAGYTFSPALKASGVTWDEATLDKWLESPMKLVPGTKMTFAGVHDASQRKDVIEYLKTLK
jgi:cytochrome c